MMSDWPHDDMIGNKDLLYGYTSLNLKRKQMSHSATETTRKEHPLEEREKLQMIVQLVTSRDVVGIGGILDNKTVSAAVKYVLDKTMRTTSDVLTASTWNELIGGFVASWDGSAELDQHCKLSPADGRLLQAFVEFVKEAGNWESTPKPRDDGYWDTLHGEFQDYWQSLMTNGQLLVITQRQRDAIGSLIRFAKNRENPPAAKNSL